MITEDEFQELKERWAENYRLPLLRDLHADRAYVCALVLFEEENPFFRTLASEVPTEEEADLLGLYIQFRNERWLSPRFIREMKENDSVDIDPGVNSYFFLKSAHRGWLYRMNSWTMGPLVIPNYDSSEKFTLLELLDRITAVAGEPDENWKKFKKENYIFPV